MCARPSGGEAGIQAMPRRPPAAAAIARAPVPRAAAQAVAGRGSAASRGYDAAWRRLRADHLRRHPLCRMCLAAGLVNDGRLTPDGRINPVPAKRSPVVDHIVPIAQAPERRLDRSNLQTLCATHHDGAKQVEEQRRAGPDGRARGSAHPAWLRPARVPLTIVCGPPAAGKSRWVAERAGPGDLVLDLDVIAAELSGQPLRGWDRRWLAPALRRRNELLAELAGEPGWPSAWLIVSEPKARWRQWWADTLRPREIVVIEAPPDLCVARVQADRARAAVREREYRAIAAWWAAYERRNGDRRVGGVKSLPR